MTTLPQRICANLIGHRPVYVAADHHHKLPQSWGGKTVPENLVWLCPNCHDAVHYLIDEAIVIGHVVYSPYFNSFIHELAQYAWDRRPDKPTRTRVRPGVWTGQEE